MHEREPGLVNSLRSFVRRRYRTVKAVDAISFDIAPGEIVGFLGPNGAGKTTTLNMLSGWEMALASLAIATTLLLASHLFWRVDVANYTSASS